MRYLNIFPCISFNSHTFLRMQTKNASFWHQSHEYCCMKWRKFNGSAQNLIKVIKGFKNKKL